MGGTENKTKIFLYCSQGLRYIFSITHVEITATFAKLEIGKAYHVIPITETYAHLFC